MKDAISFGANGIQYVLAVAQQNEILQIIEFIMSAIVTILLISYRIWHWWKEASKDGKIDEKEIDELGQIIEDVNKERKDK